MADRLDFDLDGDPLPAVVRREVQRRSGHRGRGRDAAL
jgi:hypothetical protein